MKRQLSAAPPRQAAKRPAPVGVRRSPSLPEGLHTPKGLDVILNSILNARSQARAERAADSERAADRERAASSMRAADSEGAADSKRAASGQRAGSERERTGSGQGLLGSHALHAAWGRLWRGGCFTCAWNAAWMRHLPPAFLVAVVVQAIFMCLSLFMC